MFTGIFLAILYGSVILGGIFGLYCMCKSEMSDYQGSDHPVRTYTCDR